MSSDSEEKTHFGFKSIPRSEKSARVADVFHSVAERYDVMNDLMSLGTHRVMKQMTANATHVRPGHQVLDLAGGTGDMAIILADYVGREGQVCICDINGSMLEEGRNKLLNRGITGNVTYVQADGEHLPFLSESFNAITIAFGLRNFTDKDAALRSMHRVLKPGGKLVVLEFSKPRNDILKNAYKGFSSLWPRVGKLVTGDSDSYQYLVESIEMHPDQETLAGMIEDAGFTRVRVQDLVGGVAAIHEGVKPR
ncbi:MAG: bifunctional demethylmenaquinone methyltransferase/2-methoxy-6-polyprenyl-1,4-benzoquinol methylase UbiE [Pseudomonadales bacterium]|nr:bifunctional demethylmenaquinone methyltransferase/2-methoxy-6-polyprenyl-1,4-benzoquinol methylase UbiE [Pseudomonadales bacterium]